MSTSKSIKSTKILDPESDNGNIEYKIKLDNFSSKKFCSLVSQLIFRLSEGVGECIYKIGIMDCGLPIGTPQKALDTSISTLKLMCEKQNQ